MTRILYPLSRVEVECDSSDECCAREHCPNLEKQDQCPVAIEVTRYRKEMLGHIDGMSTRELLDIIRSLGEY